MTTSELRTYIDRVLGNSIRCLLPSYWWKRLFGVTLDNIESIDQDVRTIKDRVDSIDTKVEDIDTMVEWIAPAITKKTNIASSTITNLHPNTHYTITSVPSGDVVIESVVAPESVYGADYQVSFKYPASLTLPNNVIWEGGAEPELDPTKMHVLHIKARTFGNNMVYMASVESYAPTLLHPEYLTIEALEDFGRSIYVSGGCDYMLDNSGVWINSSTKNIPTLKAGQIVTLRANANTGSDGISFNSNIARFIVRGNALAIYPDYDIDNPEVAPTTDQLFVNSSVYAVEKGILPAKSNVRYTMFFDRCVHLVNAPELPATDVVSYSEMFHGCTSLKKAPELPALTVRKDCYAGMFSGCTSLKSAPSILPAMTLEQSCYREMFRGCTSLVNAPKLPATTLAPYCYSYMFMGCSSLNYIKMLATDASATGCLSEWVYATSEEGTFVKNAAMTSLPTGPSGIPNGWTVEDAA